MIDDDLEEVARILADEAMVIAGKLRDQQISTEDDFTSRMLERIEIRFDNLLSSTMLWKCFRSKNTGHEKIRLARLRNEKPSAFREKRIGADIVMVLDIQAPGVNIHKAVLIQAKILEPGKSLSSGDHKRLVDQCQSMLGLSVASFVFIYSTKEIVTLSATTAVSHSEKKLHKLATQDLKTFFRHFLSCWIGDPRLVAPNAIALLDLKQRLDAAEAVVLKARKKTETPTFIEDQPEFYDH